MSKCQLIFWFLVIAGLAFATGLIFCDLLLGISGPELL